MLEGCLVQYENDLQQKTDKSLTLTMPRNDNDSMITLRVTEQHSEAQILDDPTTFVFRFEVTLPASTLKIVPHYF